MKILHITDFYHPFVGGVEQHVRTLASELAGRNHRVAVATLWREGLPQCELDGAVKVYRVRSMTQRAPWLFRHPHRPWAPPFPDPQATHALHRVLQAEWPDIVHGHDWLARAFLPLKRASSARFVLSLHYYTQSCAKKSLMREGPAGPALCEGPGMPDCLSCSARHYGTAKGLVVALSQRAWSAAERRAVDFFLPVSEATAAGNELSATHAPYKVIPNFVSEDAGGDPDLVASYLAQLPNEEFLLFIGDFRRDKGLHTLLEAYAGLQDAPPLVLIGKRWDETPDEFPPGVLVLGEWPNAAVRRVWQRCLFIVIPSLWPEPFGIVAIEAMSAGCPVVASAAGGLAEVVVDAETGLLAPPGNVAALRYAMGHLLDHPDLRRRFGRSARRHATRYKAAAVVPQIEEIYSRLLERPAMSRQLLEEA